MTTPNLLSRRHVEATLSKLSPLRRSHLAKKAQFGPDHLTGGQALLLWLSEFLVRYSRLRLEQQNYLMDCFCNSIVLLGDKLFEWQAAGAKEFPAYCLMIADEQFASLTSVNHCFIDFVKGEVKRELNKPPIVVVSYNLTEMLRDYCGKLARRQGDAPVRADREPGAEGGVDEPEHVRHVPPGDVP